MLTIYKIIVNLVYVLAWPFFKIKQMSMPAVWGERRGFYPGLTQSKDCLWYHASSVGEVRVLERLIKSMRSQRPNLTYVVSTYTITGQELAKSIFEDAEAVFYFPIDCYFPLRRLFELIHPTGIVIVETEIWPYFLDCCRKDNIPIILANGRLSRKSSRDYRHFRDSLARLFSVYKAFLVQSQSDAERIEGIGAEKSRIQVLGNVKHDVESTSERLQKREDVRSDIHLPENEILFIAASTRPGEEIVIMDALREMPNDVITILAPRHLERLDEVRKILKEYRTDYCLFSELKGTGRKFPVILMDKMGLLKDLFYGADIAFVGGTIAKIGGHNIMEPVLAGVPVLFGSSIFNVEDAAEKIIANNWGQQVRTAEDLADNLRTIIKGASSFKVIASGGESVASRTTDIIIKEFGL